MPTTSNFGWTTPADTDLVKDGAAAIRTLGNGIDTSLVDLKGGTTGQILSKASNTDLDYTWIANDQGDITEVQAGTGISVASGTGPVPVVTNTMATAVDAKGDLIVGTGADTFARLAVGTNGYTLVADSSVSPTGLKWAAPAATFNTGYAYTSSSQNTTSTTYVDLATVTSVTVTTGTKALVTIKAMMGNNGVANVWEHVSFAVSGATTVAAADERSMSAYHQAANNNIVEAGAAFVITGLTAGSNTFTLKFSAQGGGAGTTAYFERRSISVVDLGS